MKLIKLLAFAIAALPIWAGAQGLTALKCLAEAPDAVIPLIEKNTRLDMIDYFTAGMSKPSANKLKGECSIIEMDDASVTFSLTDSARCQMFVLNPASASPIIGVITTYPSPLRDSSVDFYTTRWQKLAGIMPSPTLSAWLTSEGKGSRALVEEQLPFILASCAYYPETQTIVATNNTGEYFAASDKPEALGLLKKELVYRWDGKKFKLADK
ncbi:MAG: DUF3256 family protein [Clostridium sp.]|nr:DUF3256 family protein [Clostridium sp.]